MAGKDIIRGLAIGLGALLLVLVAGRGWATTTVRVGIYSNPPKVTLPHGGIYVHVLEHVAARRDYALQYVPGSFQEGMARLARGEIDVMVDVAKSPERAALFDLTAPVLQSWNTVYARHGSGIRSLLSLEGRRVAVLAGSVQEQFLRDAVGSLKVNAIAVPYATYEQAFDAVRRGAVDAVVGNPYVGSTEGADLDDTSIVFGATTLHFAVRKGDASGLRPAIDAYLAEVETEPNSFFFREQQQLLRAQRDERLPAWVLQAVAVAGVVLALALGWAYSWKRAAAKLREGEARQRQLAEEFQRVFDSSIDTILVLDERLVIRRASPAVRSLGYEPLELVGKSALRLVAPALRGDAEARLLGLRGQAPIASRAAQAVRSDGSLVEISYSAVWSTRQHELFCVIRDETERNALLRSVEQRSEELQRANDDLQIVSYSLSHDLRAPLSAVRGFASHALESAEPDHSARVRRMLERTVAAAERMETMVADLSALLRVAGEQLQPRSCDLTALAQDVAAALAERGERAADIHVQPGLRAEGDARLLRVALENLLGNACKFSAHAQQPSIVVGEMDTGPQGCAFFVRDNGAGFDPDYADRLFRPFSRLHSREEFAGSGMGLTIVHRIVSRHGGRIWAQGAPGQGATFFFTLPRGAPASRA